MAFTDGDPGESSIDADVGNALGGGSASSSNDKDFGSDSGPQSGPNVGSKDFGQNLQDRPQGPAFGGMDMADFFSFEREGPKTLLSSCCFPPQTKRKGGSLSHTHKTHKTYKT